MIVAVRAEVQLSCTRTVVIGNSHAVITSLSLSLVVFWYLNDWEARGEAK